MPEKPFLPKRIFLSYGHDEHTSLALRLRDDLRLRGHDVWFDEDRLRPGHDWEAFIEKGLEHLAADRVNSAVLLLLTPYSVRRPDGYCLNEVSRALLLGLDIIPVMVVDSEPPLSICRIQWLDMRECIPISEKEALYRPRFERLLQAIEEGKIDFEGSQSRLLRTLQPIRFSADIVKLLKDFTGREWVFARIDAWLQDPAGSKIFWITGAPGVGKSAIAAWIRENRREIAAFHFCDANSEEKRNPAKLVLSIVYQLSTQLPEYQDRLARLPLEEIVREYHEAYTLFDKLLVQPLAEGFPAPDRTVVVLIDALDEATYSRRNEIVRFLTLCAGKTPPWLRFLVTSRDNEPEIVSSLRALSPYVLDTAKEENVCDLRAYLRKQLPEAAAAQIEAILDRSEGVFLYVRHVCEAIRAGHLSLERPDEFPRGLGDVYQQFFDRQFGLDMTFYEEKITPLLQPILAAFEPLTLGLLKRVCGIATDTEMGRLLNRLGSLFPASGEGEAEAIRPFHRSLCDWITSREAAGHYLIAVPDGHRVLGDYGRRQYEQGPEAMEDYFLEWLPSHLLALGDDDRLVGLLKDFRYLMEKARRGMMERLLQDYGDLPARLTTTGASLEFETAFFREKAHILRRDHQGCPPQINLLQLAIAHADTSPVTSAAEAWVAIQSVSHPWFRLINRPKAIHRAECLRTMEGHATQVSVVVIHPDGRRALSGDSGMILIWDLETGACIRSIRAHQACVRAIAVHPDERRVISAGDDQVLRVWDIETGECVRCLKGHTFRVNAVAVHPDGQRAISGAGDGTLRLWDLSTGTCLRTIRDDFPEVKRIVIAPDGQCAVSASMNSYRDFIIKRWDMKSGDCLHTIRLDRNIEITAIHPGARYAIAPGRLLDIQTGEVIRRLEGYANSVSVHPNGRSAIGAHERTLRLWNIETGMCTKTIEVPMGWDLEAAIHPDGVHAVTGGGDRNIRLWDLNAAGDRAVKQDELREIVAAAIHPDGRHVISASVGKNPVLWKLNGDGREQPLDADEHGRIEAVAIDPQGRRALIACGMHPVTMKLVNLEDGQCIRVFQGHWGSHIALAFFPDGRYAVSASGHRRVKVWDLDNGECVRTLGEQPTIVAIAVLPDGKNAVIATYDGELQLLDLESGARELGSREDILSSLALLPDGRRVLSAGKRTISLWEADTGHCLARWQDDGIWLVTCSSPPSDPGLVTALDRNGAILSLRLIE